jgi:hypothetical protein
VLCIDKLPLALPPGDLSFYSLAEIASIPSAKTIIEKYSSSRDKLRWCLKPVFLTYLLNEKADKVIYVDNDIFFFNDYLFLFDLLDSSDFLLTPHHYPRDPHKDQNWLEANFRVGLYNAGFVAVAKGALKDLSWWADCCAYRCEKNPIRGIFDDQKYLDLIPIMNEKAHIIRHKGCNIAEWNSAVISRTETDGQLFLDQIFPLIFIHFNGTTVRAIHTGSEPALKTSFDKYLSVLKKHKADISVSQLFNAPSIFERIKYRIWKIATDLSL